MSKITRFIGRGFSVLWRSIRVFCTTVWVLFTLALVISLVAVLSNVGDSLPKIPEQGALVVSINGGLVDEVAVPEPMDMLTGDSSKGVLLRDWIASVTEAANDERITTLVLQLDGFSDSAQSKLAEFGDALQVFRDSGKKIIANATSYNQSQYFLASYADEIYMHPVGGFSITVFSCTRLYFKDALDKFKVDYHIFKVGTYKDAVEPYMINKMSQASREHNELLYNQQWQAYTTQVEKNRQLPEGRIQQFVETGRQQLIDYHGDNVEMVKELGLIDEAKNSYAFKSYLEELLGTDKKSKTFAQINIADYNTHRKKSDLNLAKDQIAVVVAAGEIVDGKAGPGKVGGDTLVAQLKEVREDDNTKALVLRVDSPGGSAFASELIREELVRIKAKGIPIVVSMGGLAASGGYWISADADEIWATPTTITGSIGVFGMLPSVERALTEVGVTSDQVGSKGAYSAPDLMSGVGAHSGQAIQVGVEHIYQKFLSLVADGRDSSVDEIDKIAQGRVWTGRHALEIGLVDKLGSLNDAIASAAKLAKLEEYGVSYFEKEASKLDIFLKGLSAKVGIEGWLDSQTAKMLKALVAPVNDMTNFNDPKGLYLYCSDCSAR